MSWGMGKIERTVLEVVQVCGWPSIRLLTRAVAAKLGRPFSLSLYRSVARAVRNLARLEYVLAMSKAFVLVRETKVISILSDPKENREHIEGAGETGRGES